VTAPHYHPVRGSKGLQAVEHEHPGPEHRHVHEGDFNLLASVDKDPMERRMERMALAGGRKLRHN
jgi:hypothetical protein